MSQAAGLHPPLLHRGGAGPALIAHAAGNRLDRVEKAIEEGADFLEVDLYVHKGRFEARHERAAYPLPFWIERWYLRIAPRSPIGLAELVEATRGRARILLDLKNGGARAAGLVREVLDQTGPGVHLAASSQQWPILRSLRELCPEVELYYSIDVQARLDLFLSVAEREPGITGVSCRHTLLKPQAIVRLKDMGLRVVAWTVDSVDRALELALWEVDGITTHRVRELNEALAGRPR
jgi:glycerophosphoryl diester phosphodiesterase